MKAYHFLDKLTEKVSHEYEDMDTYGELFDFAERDEIERKMKEVQRELQGGEKI